MLKDRLDKYFKEELASNPQWDKEALWNDIASEMDAPKKRRRFLIFLVFGVAFIALVIGAVLFTDQNKARVVKDDKTSLALTETTIDPSEIEDASDLNIVTNDQNLTESEIKEERSIIYQEDIEINKALSENKKDDVKDFLDNQFRKRASEQSVFTNQDIEVLLINTQTDEKPLSSEGRIASNIAVLKQLPGIHSLGIEIEQNPELINPKAIELQKKPEVVKDNRQWHQLELFAGIGFANRNLNAKLETVSSIINTRNTNESILEKRSLGLIFRKAFYKRWHFTTGVLYGEQHEKMNVAYTDQRVESRKKADAYVYNNANGMNNFIAGEVDVTITQDFDIQHYNVMKTINVPVLVGYHIQKSKVGFVVEAGPSFNISQTFSGRIFDETNNELNTENVYKKRSGLGAQLSADFQYLLFDGLSISSGFAFTKQFGSSIQEIENYRLTYSDLSFNIGTTLQF
jgi:hypothetical protein